MKTAKDEPVSSPDDYRDAGSIEDRQTGKTDYLPFVWQKLNDIDTRLGELGERHARIEIRLDSVEGKLNELSGKTAKFDRLIVVAGTVIATVVTFVGGLWTFFTFLSKYFDVVQKAASP